MSSAPIIERATFRICESADRCLGEPIPVHFNPQTLQYTITNNLPNPGSGKRSRQYTATSTGKLVMDLIFDTTASGEDVRIATNKVARLMEPQEGAAPPQVEFVWGLYRFVGMVEGYRETLDFFSADGVPLRSAINLTLASQDKVFERGIACRPSSGPRAEQEAAEVDVPGDEDGRGVTATATRLGDPAQSRALAERSGIENPRFPGRRSILVQAQEDGRRGDLSVPAAGSAGGAFSALRTQPEPATCAGRLDVRRARAGTGTERLRAADASAVDAAGKHRGSGDGGERTDVGRRGQLRQRIQFVEES